MARSKVEKKVLKGEHICKGGACPCSAMTKKRLKKSIERFGNALSKISELDAKARYEVMKNVATLIEVQKSFVEQSVMRLKKSVDEFEQAPIIEDAPVAEAPVSVGKSDGFWSAISGVHGVLETWMPSQRKAKLANPW